jgi:hypothetical protein
MGANINNIPMKLDENYAIEQDAYNFILHYENEGDVNPKTGKPTVTVRDTFHPTLEQALLTYASRCQNVSEGVDRLLDSMQETRETIKKAINARK